MWQDHQQRSVSSPARAVSTLTAFPGNNKVPRWVLYFQTCNVMAISSCYDNFISTTVVLLNDGHFVTSLDFHLTQTAHKATFRPCTRLRLWRMRGALDLAETHSTEETLSVSVCRWSWVRTLLISETVFPCSLVDRVGCSRSLSSSFAKDRKGCSNLSNWQLLSLEEPKHTTIPSGQYHSLIFEARRLLQYGVSSILISRLRRGIGQWALQCRSSRMGQEPSGPWSISRSLYSVAPALPRPTDTSTWEGTWRAWDRLRNRHSQLQHGTLRPADCSYRCSRGNDWSVETEIAAGRCTKEHHTRCSLAYRSGRFSSPCWR